jgi:hypothetical protein
MHFPLKDELAETRDHPSLETHAESRSEVVTVSRFLLAFIVATIVNLIFVFLFDLVELGTVLAILSYFIVLFGGVLVADGHRP